MTSISGNTPLIEIDGVDIAFDPHDHTDATPVVKKASLKLFLSEVLALVGESGSGKTLLSKSIVNLLPNKAKVTAGRILIDGSDTGQWSDQQWRQLRGKSVGMIFQEPLTSLNPAMTIGRQLSEGLKIHSPDSDEAIKKACLAMLSRVKIANPSGIWDQYPHQFSGGMRQRIMLAAVMLLKPKLIIADEPTTALDVIIQKEILDILMEISADHGTSVLLITHDLGIVAQYAQRIAVMENGVIVESGQTERVFAHPQHPYTLKLLRSLPGVQREGASRASDTRNKPTLLQIEGLRVEYGDRGIGFWRDRTRKKVLKDISLRIGSGETLALVGESGSGKTTLGRSIIGLAKTASGIMHFDSKQLLNHKNAVKERARQGIQIVFQDPYSSLDPRMKIGAIVGEGLQNLNKYTSREIVAKVTETLTKVGLDSSYLGRFPHELSGGQRQRISIARALVMEPKLLIADEPVSALDVTVQSQILDLLSSLQADYGFACLLITHDLSVVAQVADRVAVMYHGKIVEEGKCERVFASPGHPYTQALLRAAPMLVGDGRGGYRLQEHVFHPATEERHADIVELEHIELDLLDDNRVYMREVNESHWVLCGQTLPAGGKL